MAVNLRGLGADRDVYALEVVQKILSGRMIGGIASLKGDVPEEVSQALWAANEATAILFSEAGYQYNHAEWYADLAPGVQYYEGPTAFQKMEAEPHIEGLRELRFETPDSLWQQYRDTDRQGVPHSCTFWNEEIGLYPVPNEALLRYRYCFYNTFWYVCLKSTEDAELTTPDLDTDYWAKTAVVPGEEADYAYNPLKNYQSGRVRMLFRSGLTLMADDEDEMPLPSRYLFAVVAGGKWKLAEAMDAPGGVQDRLKESFDRWVHMLKGEAPFGDDPPITDVNQL